MHMCYKRIALCLEEKKKKRKGKEKKKPQYDSALYTAPIANLTSSIW